MVGLFSLRVYNLQFRVQISFYREKGRRENVDFFSVPRFMENLFQENPVLFYYGN